MLFSNELELRKSGIVIKPLSEAYFQGLAKLACEEKIWAHAPEPYHQGNLFKEKWLAKAMRQQEERVRLPFVILYHDEIAGSSSYYEIDEDNKKLNIGYTWFHPSYWGSPVNAISKLLMIKYVLETMQYNRVGFSVDNTNERSCLALAKLGIKHEGTLRNHIILPNGRVRDSAIFSVIREEWLDIKTHIKERIAAA
jgi:N-acetyltransferase